MPSIQFVMQWTCWGWTKEDCLKPFQQFDCPTVILQCNQYINNNKSKSAKKQFRIRTDGAMRVRMCSRYPFVLKNAAWMANEYENRNPHSTHTATLILVVLWEVFSDMRFVFWVLWQSKFDKNDNNDRPILIDEMLKRGWRAIWLAHHLCSILVCQIFVL